MIKIERIFAEEIFDSRGTPTLKVSVIADGIEETFSVPSGASTGVHEAHELRDGDKSYYGGKGVNKAIDNVNSVIALALMGHDVLDQSGVDRVMMSLDGTKNKEKLGANALIGVSIAIAKAAGRASCMEIYTYLRKLADIKPSRKIPYFYMNLINGGKHANNGLAFQEYHVVPMTEDADEALCMGRDIQGALKEILRSKLGDTAVVLGDEGGFAPKLSDVHMPLRYLSEAVEKSALSGKVRFALDVAASSFYDNGLYEIGADKLTGRELLELYNSLIQEFNLISIEDPFHEEDFDGFRELREHNKDLLVVGDDLTVTNPERLQEAIDKKSVDAMIIKPNQIGTLSETLETMKLARDNGVELIVSHRSGETGDDFIADLAYAFGCFGLKAGAPLKQERRVKYERLIDISR